MPIPINPVLLRSGAQALSRVAKQAVKAAPGLIEKAGASRVAAKAMSGLSGLSTRLPSALPTAAQVQQGIAGMRPRLDSATKLLGQMGDRLGQAAQLAQMLPSGHTGTAEPAETTLPTRPSGPTKPMTPLGHIPLGQFAAIRDSAHAALKGPMAQALQGSDRAVQVISGFLQALNDIESSKLYQNFAPALVNQMLGEAKAGLQGINDLIERFQDGIGKLDTALQPPPTGTTPRPQPPKLPPLPKPSLNASTSASTSSTAASEKPEPTTPNGSARTDDSPPTSVSAQYSEYSSAQSNPTPETTPGPKP